MKYIGIDIGSTSVKSAVFDLDTHKVTDVVKMPSPVRMPNPDAHIFEVEAEAYFGLISSILNAAVQQHGDIEGLVLSTQMHGFVINDVYVSWQDSRCLHTDTSGKSHLDRIRGILGQDSMTSCGVKLKTSLGLCNLYAKLCEENRLDTSDTLYTLGSYLIWRLTGENVCHISNAAPLGFADLESHSWKRSLLEKLGIRNIKLPVIAAEEFLPAGTACVNGCNIKVFPDYGDQQTAILGSVVREDEAFVNIGTAAQVCVISQQLQFGDYELRPYFEESYIKVVSNMAGGRNLDVLVNFLVNVLEQGTGQSWSTDVVRARFFPKTHRDTHGLQVAPMFYPTEYAGMGGSISGITSENLTAETLFSASFRYMAQQYWENICKLTEPERIAGIVCAGGVSWKNDLLVQQIGETAKRRCRLSSCPDEALAGLFRLALRCGGYARDLTETQRAAFIIEGGKQ